MNVSGGFGGFRWVAFGFVLALATSSSRGLAEQNLRGHVPPRAARLQPVGRLNGTNQLHLAIGLPLRNGAALTNLLRELYDPGSPRFGRYLTPGQFTERFGPTAEDYQAAIDFAKAHRLSVAATHPNRVLLDVSGEVADVEDALGVKMQVYSHPVEARTFFAPENEPVIRARTPFLHISGLDDYTRPEPRIRHRASAEQDSGTMRSGSGPKGQFTGKDFRAAYVQGTALTGAGQAVGLFELNGYYTADITAYESRTGLPNVPLQKVLIDGFNGSAGGRRPGSMNEEVALDIEMVISMAPGLARVLVYEGSPTGTTATINHVLNRMATDNLAKQLSCSWGFDIDETTQQIFLQYAAQGQSFYLAAGDSGAFSGVVTQPADNPFVTVVGGTTLTTTAAGAWQAETTWSGTGGGSSTVYPIPDWQQGVDMSANHGSSSMRNVPDVAMLADNVLINADNGQQITVSGTSIAAPLWAGFTALVNEQAAAQGKPPLGFANPALYRVGKSAGFATCFHDITTGNNTSSDSPNLFVAVAGYDLCTGFGTPNGTNLIEALLEAAPGGLVVSPPLGLLAIGKAGGPFQPASQTYTLTNSGTAPLTWQADTAAAWLDISPTSGVLTPGGGSAVVTVGLNSSAGDLLLGSDTAEVSFTDVAAQLTQHRLVSLSVGNAGFETGDFSDWTLNGQQDVNFVDSLDSTQFSGTSNLPGVDDSNFTHSGIYGAFLGQNSSLGYLSQTLPTVAGRRYLVSFWLANPLVGTPNEFTVTWSGTTLFDQVSLGQFGWTNLQYVVTATGVKTELQFGFRNDQNAFALDEILVQPIPAPKTAGLPRVAQETMTMTWTVLPGLSYQLQSTTDLGSGAWTDVGSAISSPNSSLTTTDGNATGPQRFYRLVTMP